MSEALSVQLALFCSSGDTLHADEIFHRIFSVSPETSFRSRTVGPTNPLLSQAIGNVNGLQFVVQTQIGRIDLFARAITGGEISFDNPFPTFEWEPVVDAFCGIVDQVSTDGWGINRVALIPSVCIAVGSYDDAALIIGEMIGADLSRSGLSDLMFQVARMKDLGSLGVINRHIKVAVAAIQTFDSTEQRHIPVSVPKYAVHLSLDFNSKPVDSPLHPAIVSEVANVLRQELIVVARSKSAFREILDEK